MKCGAKIILWVSAILVAVTSAQALTDDSPYGRIVERNIFSLKDAPPPPPPPPPPVPKITLQGITSILGMKQVLLKFPVQGGKEQSFVLNEGERQEDVEVLVIDEKEGSVKFNNHGTIQTLTMEKDAAKAPTIAAAVPAAIPAAVPRPIPTAPASSPSANPAQTGGGVTSVGGGLRSIPTRNLRTGTTTDANDTGGGLVSGSTVAPVHQPRPPDMTSEEQTIMIEIERERTKADVEAGELPPLPLTELTPPGSKGMPELSPSE